jgi:hypothetical protein
MKNIKQQIEETEKILHTTWNPFKFALYIYKWYYLQISRITYKLTAPFNWKKATKGLDWKGKLIAILYFPQILIMWYGYYAWRTQ